MDQSVENSEMIESGEKVVIIGDASVGKTSILLRYVNNTFSDNIKATIGCDHYEKEVTLPDKRQVKLSIWDTAGQERFRGLASSYYKRAKCVILVFDITKSQTFQKLDFWRDEIMNFANDDILVMVVGNKSDLQQQRTVHKEEIEQYVQKHKYFYIETSALDNGDDNIKKVFEYVAENINKNVKGSSKTLKNVNIQKSQGSKLNEGDNEKKKDSCSC